MVINHGTGGAANKGGGQNKFSQAEAGRGGTKISKFKGRHHKGRYHRARHDLRCVT